MKKIFTAIILSVILASCTQIPYDEEVYPVFKKVHPQAAISQIFPIGGYGLASYTAQKTDVVILFEENGSDLAEIWTVTRTDGWTVVFKCKSINNACI